MKTVQFTIIVIMLITGCSAASSNTRRVLSATEFQVMEQPSSPVPAFAWHGSIQPDGEFTVIELPYLQDADATVEAIDNTNKPDIGDPQYLNEYVLESDDQLEEVI